MIAVLPHEPELGPQKRCSHCGEWWPADSDFYQYNRATRDGFHSWCKACWAAWRREHSTASIRPIEPGESEGRCLHFMRLRMEPCWRRAGHKGHHRTRDAVEYDALRNRLGRLS